MSILINMEMPKSCRDCFVNVSTAAFPACPLAENYDIGKALVVEGFGNDVLPKGCPLLPAADVRPVVLCRDCRNDCHCMIQDFMEDYGITPDARNNFFCGYGERGES